MNPSELYHLTQYLNVFIWECLRELHYHLYYLIINTLHLLSKMIDPEISLDAYADDVTSYFPHLDPKYATYKIERALTQLTS